MEFLENKTTKCLLCGESSFNFPYGKKHFLLKCRKCGMASAKNIPSNEELKSYYFNYPSHEIISPLTLQRYNEILNRLEPYRNKNTLLETGCGFGFFLEEARKRKWNVTGTEMSQKAIDECKLKNITIYSGIEKLSANFTEHFDVVLSLEVLEHIQNPENEIMGYSRLIRPGGVLYITTPNYNSLSRKILGKNWIEMNYPEHLHYFSPSTIDKILTKSNFSKIFSITTGFSPARFMYSLRTKKWKSKNKAWDNYNYNEADRELSDNIEKTILLRLIKKVINYFLIKLKSGDTLKVLYQKKG